MSTGNARAIQQLIAFCVSPHKCTIPADQAAWDELLRLALFHGVAPLLYANLKGRDLPDSVRAQLCSLYVRNSLRNEVLRAEQDRLGAAFAAHGITVLPLKGTYLSQLLYGDAAIRQVADIDILIDPQDLAICDRVMSEQGFGRLAEGDIETLRGAGELVFTKEVLASMSDAGERAKLVPVIAVDLQQRLLPYGAEDRLAKRVRAQGMTPDNLLLLLCVNQVAHRFARLKYLLDVAMCLRKHAAALQWPEFLAAARELEFTPGIYLSLAWARSLADAPVPQDVLDALHPGWFTRRLAARVLGDDAVTTLQRGAALDGPYGAFAVLAATRPGLPRWRQVWRILFPPAAYLRQEFAAAPDVPLLPLYILRLVRKLPAALRRDL